MRLLIFLASFFLGLFIVWKTKWWVEWSGKNWWAEEKLGSGGTYTLWKIIGILIIIAGFLYLIGEL